MIGALRHRVVIEKNDGATDSAGGQAADWTTVATVWAAIERLNGSAGVEAGRAIDTATMNARIRTRDDIAAGMRLLFRDETYRITAVTDPDLRGRWLVLACRNERTAA